MILLQPFAILAVIVLALVALGYAVARSERHETAASASEQPLWYYVHAQDEISGE